LLNEAKQTAAINKNWQKNKCFLLVVGSNLWRLTM